MRALLLSMLVLVAACRTGPPPPTYEYKLSKATGASEAEIRQVLAEQRAELGAMSDAELDRLAARHAPCKNVEIGPAFTRCVVRFNVIKDVRKARLDTALAGGSDRLCAETFVRQGLSTGKARSLCQAFKPECRAAYARARLLEAGRPNATLIGIMGSAYFYCVDGDQTLYAGAVFDGNDPEDLVAGRTVMSGDPCHIRQVEYRTADGRAYLWYPGNRRILSGAWEIVHDRNDPRITIGAVTRSGRRLAQYCQRYAPGAINRATGQASGSWSCQPFSLMAANDVASVAGDPFGLARGGAVPFDLGRGVPPALRDHMDPFPGSRCEGGRVVAR